MKFIQGSLRTRFWILNRDGFKCIYCGRGVEDGAKLEIEHIVPKSKGGKEKESNLATACFECNRGKFDVLLKAEQIRKLKKRIKNNTK